MVCRIPIIAVSLLICIWSKSKISIIKRLWKWIPSRYDQLISRLVISKGVIKCTRLFSLSLSLPFLRIWFRYAAITLVIWLVSPLSFMLDVWRNDSHLSHIPDLVHIPGLRFGWKKSPIIFFMWDYMSLPIFCCPCNLPNMFYL